MEEPMITRVSLMTLSLLAFACPLNAGTTPSPLSPQAGLQAQTPAAAAPLAMASSPAVPPPITRKAPAAVRVELVPREMIGTLDEGLGQPTQYSYRTYN